MKTGVSFLTDGTLYDLRNKVIWNIVYNVSPDEHALSYCVNSNNDMYAEPEFTGKYLDLNAEIYKLTGNDKVLENIGKVIEAIIEKQRSDGYLGCLPKGKELLNFSVWNQAFTILGLVSVYTINHDEKVLSVALKCAEFVMSEFIDGKADILEALNYGTQHISILYPLCKLYRITQNDRIKDYIFFIVNSIKHSELDFFDFEDILSLRSRKGIENFVILLGIVEYSDIFGDSAAVSAVRKYWIQVRNTQIRNTGNGTINELWTENGNSCMLLGNDVKANETCVAVGWIELSLTLFYHEQRAEYLDAIDKTLYNHILASVADDGTDFAYYQPNYGKKVKSTGNGMYKCCRYRGFTLFTYMNEMLFFENEDDIIPIIYTSCEYNSETAQICEITNYPFEDIIQFSIKAFKDFNFKIRIPQNYILDSIEIDDESFSSTVQDGYVNIGIKKNATIKISVTLRPTLNKEIGTFNNGKYVSYSYGCILLAQNGVVTGDCIKCDTPLKKNKSKGFCNLLFSASGKNGNSEKTLVLCDYASADNYTVWIPVAETEK